MRLIDADALEYHEIDEIGGEYEPYLGCSKEYIDRQPTVCDIEQIRSEIERLHYHPKLDFIKNDEVVEMALDIIDKYKS